MTGSSCPGGNALTHGGYLMDVLISDPSWILIACGGFIVGFLVGMTGVGAGALTTPMLLGFGIPPAAAVGTDLMFASITKASAAWRHQKLGNVHWGILGCLAAGSITAALATIAWLHYSSVDTEMLAKMIRQFLAFALVASAIAIVVFSFLGFFRREEFPETYVEPRPVLTILFGLLLGVMVTLTSVGAGAVGVAVLSLLYPRLLARRLVGTDIVHAIPLAFVSGLGHLSMGNVQFNLLVALLLGSVPGIMLGSRMVGIIPDWVLRLILAGVLLVAAYLLALEQGFGLFGDLSGYVPSR